MSRRVMLPASARRWLVLALFVLPAACADPTTSINDSAALDATTPALARGGKADTEANARLGSTIAVQISGVPTGVAGSVQVSGPRGFARTLTTSSTLTGLSNGTYTVSAATVTSSGTTYSGVPVTQSVSVSKGSSATAKVQYGSVVTTGSLALTVSVPQGTPAAVTVSGPSGYVRTLTASTTLSNLAAGSYSIAASDVVSNGSTYAASPRTQTASVTAGASAAAAVTYTATSLEPGIALNLRITGMYLTQSVQTMNGAVPLVAGRNGVLRVFALANGTNTARPSVRARVYRNGALVATMTTAALSSSVPTVLAEESATASWNFAVAGSLIQGGMSILVDVDPGNAVAESNEGDNQFPATGVPANLNVRTVPNLNLRFVPVKQGASGVTGEISSSNAESFLQRVRDMHPINSITPSFRAPYTTSYVVSSNGGNWSAVLSELKSLRATDGSTANYYGVLKVGYSGGVAGIGYVGAPTSMGWDKLPSASDVMAHELGHNWSRSHAPCGGVSNPDPSFPHSGGVIGAFGFNVRTGSLMASSTADLMGYCSPSWISDYTYSAVMNFRGTTSASTTTSASVQPGLLVWGRVESDGSLVLEPAIRVTGRAVLPARTGGFVVQGRDPAGNPLFSLSFEPERVFDEAGGGGYHFAFVVPLADEAHSRLSTLAFRGQGREVGRRSSLPAAALENAAAAAGLDADGAGHARLRWNEADLPMVMVRDAVTGEVLSFARGGDLRLVTDATEVELVATDGVRSAVRRARVRGR